MSDSLVLEQLRAIRSDLNEFKRDVRDIKLGLTSLEIAVANLAATMWTKPGTALLRLNNLDAIAESAADELGSEHGRRSGEEGKATNSRRIYHAAVAVSFWVSENWTMKKARLHTASCSCCSDGRGMHADDSGRNACWIGPLDTH